MINKSARELIRLYAPSVSFAERWNLHFMTIAELEAFAAIAEHKSFSSAAKSLNLSQSALSTRIQSLEKEIDAKLFTRGKGLKNTSLTPQGQAFLPIAMQWMTLLKETHRMISGKKYITLTLCSVHSISSYIIPYVYRTFAEQMPNVNTRLITNEADAAYQLIEKSLADAAFVVTTQYSKRVDAIPLYLEGIALICSASSTFPNIVHPSDLDINHEIYLVGDNVLTEWHKYWFPESNIPKLQTNNTYPLEILLEEKDSWCVAPMSVLKAIQKANSHLQIHALDDECQKRTIYLLVRKQETLSPMLISFLSIMKAFIISQGMDWIDETLPLKNE